LCAGRVSAFPPHRDTGSHTGPAPVACRSYIWHGVVQRAIFRKPHCSARKNRHSQPGCDTSETGVGGIAG